MPLHHTTYQVVLTAQVFGALENVFLDEDQAPSGKRVQVCFSRRGKDESTGVLYACGRLGGVV